MNRTRLSLYYLAGYLTFAGLALLLVPTFALKLLLSNGDYGEVFPPKTVLFGAIAAAGA